MVKITCRSILGLMGAFILVVPITAKEINIDFDTQGAFYTSPVVYLTGDDGQIPKLAIVEGIPTTGGVDAKKGNLTEFTSISYETYPKIESLIPFTKSSCALEKLNNF